MTLQQLKDFSDVRGGSSSTSPYKPKPLPKPKKETPVQKAKSGMGAIREGIKRISGGK